MEIEKLLKTGIDVNEINDLSLGFNYMGYFLGIYKDRMILIENSRITSIWLRPYHIQYIETIGLDSRQRVGVKCLGRKRSPATKNNYFHIEFIPMMKWLPPATGDLQPGGQT